MLAWDSTIHLPRECNYHNVEKQMWGTCYAYSTAFAINIANESVYGRSTTSDAAKIKLRNDIIKEFGIDGGKTTAVLEWVNKEQRVNVTFKEIKSTFQKSVSYLCRVQRAIAANQIVILSFGWPNKKVKDEWIRLANKGIPWQMSNIGRVLQENCDNNSKAASAHAVCIVGETTTGNFIVRNSWGKDNHVHGHFFIAKSDFEQLCNTFPQLQLLDVQAELSMSERRAQASASDSDLENHCCNEKMIHDYFLRNIPDLKKLSDDDALDCASSSDHSKNAKVPDKLWKNLTFAHDAVEKNGLSLRYISKHLHGDRQHSEKPSIVEKAVKQNGSALEHAHSKWKKDQNVVMLAVKDRSHALRFAHKDLKDSPKFIKRVLLEHPLALEYATTKMKHNKEVVMIAVVQNGHALWYASTNLKDDKEVVMIAVRQNGYALKYASNNLKNDTEIVNLITSQLPLKYRFLENYVGSATTVVEVFNAFLASVQGNNTKIRNLWKHYLGLRFPAKYPKMVSQPEPSGWTGPNSAHIKTFLFLIWDLRYRHRDDQLRKDTCHDELWRYFYKKLKLSVKTKLSISRAAKSVEI